MDKCSRILVVGAGTFGLSTAYHLAKGGYTNVAVLDKSASVPPQNSAGNDLNKIVRAEYEDPFYTELALQALDGWRTPLFAPYFHEVGYLLANSAAAPDKSKRSLQKARVSVQEHPRFRGKIVPIDSRDDVRRVAPALDGDMQWTGYLNKLAGWVNAGDALQALYASCCALGVQMLGGDGARELIYDGERCTGVVTRAGVRHTADLVILALGASLVEVLPQVHRQVTAKSQLIAHIQLSEAEAAGLRGTPVVNVRDLGFFFEPDPRTHLLKLCPSGAGYTRYDGAGRSIPLEDNELPPAAHDEALLRRLLREALPGLASRPFVRTKICWWADTADSNYVIDYVPGTKGLVVAGGDSGHAFKMLPVVGGWVKTLIESDHQSVERWRWKEGLDAGGEVSWRIGKTTDLKNVYKLPASKL